MGREIVVRHYSMGGRNAIEHIQSLTAQGVSFK